MRAFFSGVANLFGFNNKKDDSPSRIIVKRRDVTKGRRVSLSKTLSPAQQIVEEPKSQPSYFASPKQPLSPASKSATNTPSKPSLQQQAAQFIEKALKSPVTPRRISMAANEKENITSNSQHIQYSTPKTSLPPTPSSLPQLLTNKTPTPKTPKLSSILKSPFKSPFKTPKPIKSPFASILNKSSEKKRKHRDEDSEEEQPSPNDRKYHTPLAKRRRTEMSENSSASSSFSSVVPGDTSLSNSSVDLMHQEIPALPQEEKPILVPLTVRVMVVEVKNLPNLQRGFKEALNPYVKLSVSGEQQKSTSVKFNTNNPVYNEAFVFNICATKTSTGELKCDKQIEVAIFDHDNLLEHMCMGKLLVNVLDLATAYANQKEQYTLNNETKNPLIASCTLKIRSIKADIQLMYQVEQGEELSF